MTGMAFISPIEQDKLVEVHGRKIWRHFEDEAVRCVESVRKSKSWLSELPFYMLNAHGAEISQTTLAKLERLGVEYIVDYRPETEGFRTPFLNEPYAGKYFESIAPVPEDITVKIDLDMQLVKPIPLELVMSAEDKPIVGQYDPAASKQQRKLSDATSIPFDTNFIITHRKHGFYSKYLDACMDEKLLRSAEWLEIEKQYGSYYLEEYAVDWLFRNGAIDVQPAQWYQFGEGYPPVASYPRDKIGQIYFLHEHVYKRGEKPLDWEYDSLRERLAYAKLRRKA